MSRHLGVSIYALASPFRPAVQSLASQVAEPDQQGRILTVLVVIESISSKTLSLYFLNPYANPLSEVLPAPAVRISMVSLHDFFFGCLGI